MKKRVLDPCPHRRPYHGPVLDAWRERARRRVLLRSKTRPRSLERSYDVGKCGTFSGVASFSSSLTRCYVVKIAGFRFLRKIAEGGFLPHPSPIYWMPPPGKRKKAPHRALPAGDFLFFPSLGSFPFFPLRTSAWGGLFHSSLSPSIFRGRDARAPSIHTLFHPVPIRRPVGAAHRARVVPSCPGCLFASRAPSVGARLKAAPPRSLSRGRPLYFLNPR